MKFNLKGQDLQAIQPNIATTEFSHAPRSKPIPFDRVMEAL
ncbi:MAG: hypothetical protein AAF569_07785 [Pseudomonadota bacterium]